MKLKEHMEFSSFIFGFISSYLAGSLPSLREVFSKKDNDTPEERIEQCYQKALARWRADDTIRQRIAQKWFYDLSMLKKLYGSEDWDKESVTLKTLTELWAEELCKDEEVSHYITTLGLLTINEKIDKLLELLNKQESDKGQYIRRGLTRHKAVDGYIRRYCTSDQSDSNFLYYALGKKERFTLADYVTGIEGQNNKYVLYSSAQTGKTTELKQLCWELQQSGLYLPVSFEVRTNTKLKRNDLPESQYVDSREVVLIIDALDEVNGQKYEDLLEEVSGYAYEHPEMKMILSCRSNYRRERQLELFTELFLEELSLGDANDYVDRRLGKNNGFIRCVFSNQLEDFVKNPFFLTVLIDAYVERSKQLPQTKAEIYHLFIERSYKKETDEKNVPLATQHSFDESVRLLERIALGLSLTNAQSLSKDELRMCLQNDDGNLEECLRYDLIRCEEGQYSFAHNAFREWLVANYLNRVGLDKASQLATNPNGRIKPEWYNIIMLWLSMYGRDREAEVAVILGWLKKASLELVIYIDRDMLDENTRNEVLKGLLLEYKSLGIRISNIMTHDYEDLWKFGYSRNTVGFVIDELNEAELGTAYYSDLMCLCYFLNWDCLKADSDEQVEQLFCVLLRKTKESLETQGTLHDLSFLYFENSFFTQQSYLERLFAIVKDSNHYEAVRSMTRLIGEADKTDEYIDYILEKEEYVHNQQEGHTTRVVTRTAIYMALAKVKTIEGAKKILIHKFYHSNYEYHDEQEEFLNMIKTALKQVSEYIKKGHVGLAAIVEDYYSNIFKDYSHYFEHDKQSQELLVILREYYAAAGLRERGRKVFYMRQAELFPAKEGETAKLDDIKQCYIMAGLWMTVEDVKDDFANYTAVDGTDWAKASWYHEIPFSDVAEYADMLYKEKFPQPAVVTKGRERRIQAFKDFANYAVFKQIVLEMVTGLDNHSSRKEHYKKLRDLDEGYNQYAFRFLLQYADDSDHYDVGEIVKGIKNQTIYESFFMREVSGMMERPELDVTVSEEIMQRVINWARESVMKLCDRQTIYYWREAIGLMLKGEYEIPIEKLPSLLIYGSYKISRKDADGYYHREYTLFDYITERVDASELAPKVIEKLRANVENERYPLSYAFSDFIIENHFEEGYSLALRFALKGYSMSANVLETLVKKGIKVEEIKNAVAGMKVSDRIYCYSTLVRNTQEGAWVKEQLEAEYRSYTGYDLKRAVQLLISMGSMDALDYLATHPDMISDGDDYHFNYDNPNAIPSLCYFIRYNEEHKLDGHFMLNSILNSLEKIAMKSKDALIEVKQYLRQLTQKGEQYKYLNRYILTFEDKYYSSYSGIGDINEAMQLVDGVYITKTDDEMVVCKPWGDDEDIYISYNWEGHSAHIVDYLGFVLENMGIPYKLDRKDCHYTENIKEFMNAIRKGNTVIVVLSRPYLRSKNCMYELSGIMNNDGYKDRILPVVVDDTIRDDDFYVELVKYWKEQKDKQVEIIEKLRNIDPDMAEPQEVKLKEIEQVYGLLKVIKDYIDWANVDNLDALSSSRFKRIIDKIYERRGISYVD